MQSASALVEKVGVLRPLKQRDFGLLWAGQTISLVGDGIYLVAIAWQAYDLSNSPSALAAVGLAWSLPQVLLLIGAGVLSDRIDRRHLMIAGDLLRAAAVGAIGAMSIAGTLTVPWLVTLTAVVGVGQALFEPAFLSVVPMIVAGEMLVAANSLAQVVRPLAWTLIGPLIGGALVGGLGSGSAFIVDGGTFVFSAAMIALMRARPVGRDGEEASPWEDLKEGLRYARSTRWLWVGMLTALVSLIAVWGPWDVLVPYVIRNEMGGSAGSLGVVLGAGGIGSVVVALTMGQRGRLPRRAMTMLYLTWAGAMLTLVAFGLVTRVWQAALVAIVTQSCLSALLVIWYTVVQIVVPPRLMGRVMSLDSTISFAGVPLSFAIVGPVADVLGADTTLVAGGVIGCAITIGFMFSRGARDPERDGSLEAADTTEAVAAEAAQASSDAS